MFKVIESNNSSFGARHSPLIFLLVLFLAPVATFGLGQTQYIGGSASPGSFLIADASVLATLFVEPNDFPGVIRAATDLQTDIARVTRHTPGLTQARSSLGTNAIIIGTIGKSPVIDQLIRAHKIDAAQISGKWESFLIQVVPQPLPGVQNALIIAGSDKRGTIYGIYDLSEQIGVSPWYWWADVPVVSKSSLYVRAGQYLQGPPAVNTVASS